MSSLITRIKNIKTQLNNNPDICERMIKTKTGEVAMIFLKSMIDKLLLVQSVITPISLYDGDMTLNAIKNDAVTALELEIIEESEIIEKIIRNKVIILLESESGALIVDVESVPARTPTEPPTSPTLQGPREGFTESIKVTTALIRKKFPSKDLVIKDFFVGNLTNTQVSIYYLKSVSDPKVVKKIEKRIKAIKTDGILDSHYLLEFMQDRPNSLFDQYGLAEKPDIVAGKMLEGRIAIAVDGSPMIVTIPFMFFEDMQNSNDYYINPHYATFVRYIRAIGLLIATIVPGLFLAVRLYHYRIVPIRYVITINSTTQNLPFTPFLELILILVLFQILYEVSLRLPRYLGLATSIVGALVLGDTGVQAGLISPPGIIVIAVSIISIYTIPNQVSQLTILRTVFLCLGAVLGLLGILTGMVYFVNYLSTFNFYGTPYLAPYAPMVNNDLKDGLHRKSLSEMKERPHSLPALNRDKTEVKNEE